MAAFLVIAESFQRPIHHTINLFVVLILEHFEVTDRVPAKVLFPYEAFRLSDKRIRSSTISFLASLESLM